MMRGQEEAPIELMIGAVILMFVMILGFSVYQNTCKAQYEQKLDAGISKLARDIETVYMGSKGTVMLSDIDLSPTGCSSYMRAVRIVKGTSDICNTRIGSDSCMIIAVESNNFMTPLSEVINVPGETTITYDSKSGDPCDLNQDSLKDYLIYLDAKRADPDSSSSLVCNDNVWYAVRYFIRIEKTSSDTITLSGF